MQQRSRFSDAPWFPKNNEKCLIGGAGGIGSYLSYFLCRAGFDIVVFDDDILEEHNLGGQLFRQISLGQSKVDALSMMCNDFATKAITTFQQKITRNVMGHMYSFSAFDNMKARSDMFENWIKASENATVTPIFIDGRLTAEQMQIFCVTPNRIDQYRENLFDDSEVEDAPCTFKQTSHCAAMIAAHMTAFFTNHITNVYEGEVVRDVPFFFEHFIPITLTNTE